MTISDFFRHELLLWFTASRAGPPEIWVSGRTWSLRITCYFLDGRSWWGGCRGQVGRLKEHEAAACWADGQHRPQAVCQNFLRTHRLLSGTCCIRSDHGRLSTGRTSPFQTELNRVSRETHCEASLAFNPLPESRYSRDLEQLALNSKAVFVCSMIVRFFIFLPISLTSQMVGMKTTFRRSRSEPCRPCLIYQTCV